MVKKEWDMMSKQSTVKDSMKAAHIVPHSTDGRNAELTIGVADGKDFSESPRILLPLNVIVEVMFEHGRITFVITMDDDDGNGLPGFQPLVVDCGLLKESQFPLDTELAWADMHADNQLRRLACCSAGPRASERSIVGLEVDTVNT